MPTHDNSAPICIDLGCAGTKPRGFLGVDRFPLNGVDLVADLDRSLPLGDSTVDLVFASHSLEHVHDLMATMREIYRVCKHGAQVCIVAPYNEQKLNLANPYHISVFNEHTPRFWTDCPTTPVDTTEYYHPHAPHWGLSRSDHSNPGLDLRLVKLEFFYFPEFRGLDAGTLSKFRREKFDVCDQIMYHLIAWKPEKESPVSDFETHLATFQPFEPDYVAARKQGELQELVTKRTHELEDAHRRADELSAQITHLTGVHALGELRAELADVFRALSTARADTSCAERERDALERIRPDLQTITDRINHLQLSLDTKSNQETLSKIRLDLLEAERDNWKVKAAELERQLGSSRRDHDVLAASLTAAQQHNAEATKQIRHLSTFQEDALARYQALIDELATANAAVASRTSELDEVRHQLDMTEDRHSALEKQFETELSLRLQEHDSEATRELKAVQRQLAWHRTNDGALREELAQLQCVIAELHQTIQQQQEREANLRLVIDSAQVQREELAQQHQEREANLRLVIDTTDAALHSSKTANERLYSAALATIENLFSQITGLQSSRTLSIAHRLTGKKDLWESVSPAFSELQAFTNDVIGKRPHLTLRLSDDLRKVPFVEYVLPQWKNPVRTAQIALVPLLPATTGVAGIEMVSPANEILAHVTVPLNQVDQLAPTCFVLPEPLDLSSSGVRLRVFVKEADVPVAVFQLAGRRFLHRSEETAPFIAFHAAA